MQTEPYGRGGAAIVYVGETVTLGVALRQPLEGGGVVDQDYDGRSFEQHVVDDDGVVLASAPGVLRTGEDGRRSVTFTLTVGQDLLPPGLRTVLRRHLVVELRPGGAAYPLRPRPFQVRAGVRP